MPLFWPGDGQDVGFGSLKGRLCDIIKCVDARIYQRLGETLYGVGLENAGATRGALAVAKQGLGGRVGCCAVEDLQ